MYFSFDQFGSFQEDIKPKHTARVPHSFIRRKLLLLLFQQKYTNATELGSQYMDEDMDRRISELKHRDDNRPTGSSDEVYYECLLRTNFEQDKALEILRHNRPNLVNLHI